MLVGVSGVPWWHQVGKRDGNELELGTTHRFCKLQADLSSGGFIYF